MGNLNDRVGEAPIDNKPYNRKNGDWDEDIGGSGLALGETDTTAYRGDRGKIAYDHSLEVVGNPHTVTKTEVGLGNVDNLQQIPLTQKGAALGVAELDGAGTVPVAQLPNSVQNGIKVIGFWNANTNTPDLSLLTLSDGEAYQVSVSGSTSLNGETNWKARDLAVWEDGLAGNWFKIDNTDEVLSVAAKTGAVTLDTDDVSEGSNEYYTEAKVSANSNVAANTAKVTNANHTGEVTGSTALTIANNAVVTAKILDANVTLAKLVNIATAIVLGRLTAGSGVPEELTMAQLVSILAEDVTAANEATWLADTNNYGKWYSLI
ncbi:hypothetical protein KAR91_58705 [Candidatus Pacearchaeota archaeon]|nr:hypothetical protein [Candidatus Pacearchaeota archaeon]